MNIIKFLLILHVVVTYKRLEATTTPSPSPNQEPSIYLPRDTDESFRHILDQIRLNLSSNELVSSDVEIQEDETDKFDGKEIYQDYRDLNVTNSMGIRSEAEVNGEHDLPQLSKKIFCFISLIFSIISAAFNSITLIVFRRTKMLVAMSTLLNSITLCELIKHILIFLRVIYELLYLSNGNSTYDYTEANHNYILIDEGTTLTLHTISIWLSCVVVTLRYFASRHNIILNSKTSNLHSIKFALCILGGVIMFCIPQYALIIFISKEVTGFDVKKYKVSLSQSKDKWSSSMKICVFILSCCTSFIPCLWICFFTTALKKQLRVARDRRLKLALPGSKSVQDLTKYIEMLTSNQNGRDNCDKNDATSANQLDAIIDRSNGHPGRNSSETRFDSRTVLVASTSRDFSSLETKASIKNRNSDRIKQQQQYEVSSQETHLKYVDENETLNSCCGSSTCCFNNGTSDRAQLSVDNSTQQKQQSPLKSQLLVKSIDATTVLTSFVPPSIKILPDSDQEQEHNAGNESIYHYQNNVYDDNINDNTNYLSIKTIWMPNHPSEQKPVSDLGDLQPYSLSNSTFWSCYSKSLSSIQLEEVHYLNASAVSPQPQSSKCSNHVTNCQQNSSRKILRNSLSTSELFKLESSIFRKNLDKSDGRLSGPAQFDRSVRGISMSPVPIITLEAARRQINNNELADKLSTAVLIVFLICQLPPGILATLCANLDKNFFYYAFQPSRVLIHLSYIVGGSVNLALNCAMSSKFRENLNELKQALFNKFRWWR